MVWGQVVFRHPEPPSYADRYVCGLGNALRLAGSSQVSLVFYFLLCFFGVS